MIIIVLLAGMIAFALFAVISKDLLYSVIFLAFVSLMLSLSFLILQAPDIAITEATVKAGLMTLIFVIAIQKTVRLEK
ncbi:MAG: DUF4040 domain-containing protein [Candidatus Aenigmarchaeota archaeon]|nr:DUF4040 domain-containing protein [Candidatus Aenigmarchaeota archaeon]